MFQESVAGVPSWLLDGIALGVAGSLVVAGIFALGVWLYPTAARQPNTGVSGDSNRRDDIRAYLDDIGERYLEDYTVDGETVAFYLPHRDVAVTFDARTYYRLDRTPTHPVLVEHEMPGVNLGYRLPFETPTPDREPSTRVEPMTSAFEILGVTAAATDEEIRRAYRDRVKEVHPDHGGDREAFERVREAYTTVTQQS